MTTMLCCRAAATRGLLLASSFVLVVVDLLLWSASATAAKSPSSTHYINSIAGPYRIVPDHVERCPRELEAGIPVDYQWKAWRDRHHLDVWTYWVNFTMPCAFDEAFDCVLNWASWSSRGGWKENAQVMKIRKFCEFAPTYVPDVWRRLMQATFRDPNRRCPFPAANYEVKNITSDFSAKFLPVFFYGTWRVTLRLFDERRDTAVCAVLFAKIVPRVT